MSIYFNFIYLLVVAVLLYPTKMLATKHRIDADYYWGSPELRSQKHACDLSITQVICYLRCGKDYICEGDECKCNEEDKPMMMYVQASDNDFDHPYQHKQRMHLKQNAWFPVYVQASDNDFDHPYQHKQRMHLKQNAWFPEHLRSSTEQDTKMQTRRDKPIERPVLRHHIAHFCPNLDVARECITNCMKLGKPAFCGKDHVCYCGHRYSSDDDQKKIDVNDIYIQYRDIYEKYFGPQDNQSETDNGDNAENVTQS